MTEESNIAQLKCPICGRQAEEGYLYGADGNTLRWVPGEPSMIKNLKTGLGMGRIIGDWPVLEGPNVKGLRCDSCNKIILDAH